MTLLLDRPSQQALLELKRVLIVDDEEPIRRLLGYMLQSHGYETVLAVRCDVRLGCGWMNTPLR